MNKVRYLGNKCRRVRVMSMLMLGYGMKFRRREGGADAVVFKALLWGLCNSAKGELDCIEDIDE